MNNFQIFLLKALRKAYARCLGGYKLPPLQRETNPDKVSEMIYNLLTDDKPCMIARFGSTELSAIVNYLGVINPEHSAWKFIKGEHQEWWWNKNIMNQMQQWSGFFPPTEEMLNRFCRMMLEDAREVDMLGSWVNNESYVKNYLPQAAIVHLRLLEPFWCEKPWTKVLEGKKVLVVHPFAKVIEHQYQENRTRIFGDKEILPKFELKTIQAVQSLGGADVSFRDWFEALHYMEQEIDKQEYDVCLIGCGAYGFPLAAHVKRKGKKAVHLGGALQLLFGIRGRRWENPNYGVKEWGIPYAGYSNLMNNYWIRPGEEGKPENANQVEGACYW